jgi:SAM-dependent methyltransferase
MYMAIKNHKQLMKHFWNAKASEHAPFYIATWRGYEQRGLEDFFIEPQEAQQFLSDAGYTPTGQDYMLEIGCGIGRMTHGFAPLFQQVHAIDVSGEMIRRAKHHGSHLKNVYFYETSGSDLCIFANNSFDFCFSYIVFQHIPDKAIIFNYIREASRVLKPEGVFHFQVKGTPDPDAHTHPVVLAIKRTYRQFIRRPALTMWRVLQGKASGFESSAWMGCSLTEDEVRWICAQSGLEVRNVTGVHTQYMWVTTQKKAAR